MTVNRAKYEDNEEAAVMADLVKDAVACDFPKQDQEEVMKICHFRRSCVTD